MRTPKAVKSQAIADLLAQILEEKQFTLDDEVLGEVAMAEVTERSEERRVGKECLE